MKRNKLFYLFLLLSAVGVLNAQIDVTLHKPPSGKLKFEDLWWLDLNNTQNTTYTVYLHAEVTESKTGLIARGNSNEFKLSPGFKRIRKKDIKEVKDVWYHKDYENFITRTGEFPPGRYTVCITVIDVNTKRELGKDCYQQEVKPFTPPRLISPEDGSVVKEPYPLFSWTPVMPSIPDVEYKIRIVEILKGQTKEEAMKSNPPYFEQDGIKTTNFR